jgi:hypothetical protein
MPHRVAGHRPRGRWRAPALTLLALPALVALLALAAPVRAGVAGSCPCAGWPPPADAVAAELEGAGATHGGSLPATDAEPAGAGPVIPVRHFVAAVLVVTVFVGILVFAVGTAPRRRS